MNNFNETGYCKLRHDAITIIGNPWCGLGVAIQEHREKEIDKYMVQNGCIIDCEKCDNWRD